MKKKILFCAGIGSLMLFGLEGNVLANAPKDQTEKVSTMTSTQDILCQDNENGLQFSVDGGDWESQVEYEKNVPEIDWWTASEYEKWISEQKKELEALIGTGNGWYDGQGVYHEWTKESVDAEIKQYEETLEEIKSGILHAKPNKDRISYVQTQLKEDDIVSSYSIDITKEDGSEVHIGDYKSEKELKKAIDEAVKNGDITREEVYPVTYK